MSRLSKRNSAHAILFVLAALWLVWPGQVGAKPAEIRGSALRPTPLLMPMDYLAARAQAWLVALKNAAAELPPAAHRRLADLTADKSVRNALQLALAATLFPVDVITPHISSSQEISVYLKHPESLNNFSQIVGDVESLAMSALLLHETETEIEALGRDWPNSLDEAREKTEKLEAHAAVLDALWETRPLIRFNGRPNAPDEEGLLQNLAKMAPQNPVVRLLLAEALLSLNKPQQSIDEINTALDLARNYTGEKLALWSLLRPRARHARALAQWRLNQLALAEDDLNAALQGAEKLPPASKIRLHEARGTLRMRRGDAEGMCADFSAACALGNCHSLARASRAGHCKQ